ncbi:conjugal transfer protein TraG [Niastella vici]|uniref:Conjugal transfer protein TraG n=1 Tax=Niastella vici TaxID=1703345 RepID=A0A1V9G4B1_9BACT|nr:TraG family conjugative transposon ATPase [Niastella vici]OQP65485.1 conjugal transfer protein TraG [Niastella vici]
MRKLRKLEDILPIYKVENDTIISKQGDITVAFKVELPEIFTLAISDFEALHQTWIKAIRVMPLHTVIHKQDWFTESTYQADFSNTEQSFLSQASERFFNERPYLTHECYLFLTKKPAGRKLTNSLFSNLIRPTLVPQTSLDSKLIEGFMDKVGQFCKILEDSGYFQLHRIIDAELVSTDDKPGLIEKYCYLLQPGQPPVMRDLSIGEEIKIGDLHCSLFTLADVENLPSLCGPRINYDRYSTDKTKFSVAFAAPLSQLLHCNHLYNQYIVIDDAQTTLKKLESKRLRLQSLSAYSRENSIGRDAVNSFLNEAISNQRLPVKAHFNILTWTPDKDRSKDIRNTVSAALAQMDARTKLETTGAAQVFWAGLPGNAADLPGNELFDTFCEQATCFLNMETNYRSSLSPIGLRLGERINGLPVHVDISDEPILKGVCTNRNKFILGPSGSGKSFFTNHMMRSYLERGAHCVIVDVGHSYRGLCELVNGYYFTYSEKDPIRFNPFYLGDEVLDTERKESIKTLLLALWKKDDENFSRSEYVSLSNALQAYFDYLKKDTEVFPCFNSFYEYLRDKFLMELRKQGIKDKDFDIDNFLYILKPYYAGGEFDYLLNSTKNLDLLSQPFIVFELDNIAGHPTLFPVVTLIIMETFISKMRKLKGIRKIILIEEAWKAIMRQGMAEYIKYLFKTVRKYFGEAIVVTQDVDDIISSPFIKDAIINNSDCKILLDQTKYINKFQHIQELLGLSEKEKTLILSMNKANDPMRKYKEVFISLGSLLSKVYRTEVSLEEYLCYTTEEKEKIKVQAYAEKYGSIKKGIAMLANHLRNQNAA